MSEEPLFDPSLKKKKKKKIVAFSEDPLGADADPATPAPPLLDEGSGTSTPLAKETVEAPPTDDLDFTDLKKKKKSKKAKLDLEAFEKELDEANKEEDVPTGDHLDALEHEDLGDDVFARDVGKGLQAGHEPWRGSDRDYTYEELLDRFYSLINAQNPSLLNSGDKKYTIVPPSIQRDGNKKTVFANIGDISKRMRRPMEHVMQFMLAEMGTTGNVGGDEGSRLTLKGRFQQRQIEMVLRRYIVEYVTCKTCKSPETELQKENRLYFVQCHSCQSRRSVNTIKTGFQAQVGRRSKNKT